MRKRTIEKILRGKLIDWCSTITDKDLRERILSNTIVTGGSIASLLLDDEVNDFDVYFRDKQLTKDVAEYYVKLTCLNDDGVKVEETTEMNINGETEERVLITVPPEGVVRADRDDNDTDGDKYHVQFISQNAITLSNKLQIVVRFYGEPDEIHNNYDFEHACNYYDSGTDKLQLTAEALECIINKRLVYRGSLYPVCSLFRIRKFMDRGWRISAGEILKIALQISAIDLFDKDVLESQLIGVDAAYFNALLSAIENGNRDTIDSQYLIKLIDEIWNE